MSPCSFVTTASTNDSTDDTDDTIAEGSPSLECGQGSKKTEFARAENFKEDRKIEREEEKNKVIEKISASIAYLGAVLKKKGNIINY